MPFTAETRRLVHAMAPLHDPLPLTGASKQILAHFLSELQAATRAISAMKMQPEEKMQWPSGEFPMPSQFQEQHFPEEVIHHLRHPSAPLTEVRYHAILGSRSVTIRLVCEEASQCSPQKLRTSIERIMQWIWILNRLPTSSSRCGKHVTIFLYWTRLKKALPEKKQTALTLGQIHVNTAFTTSCPADAEIVIFRQEEWFKVFLHESFHTFGLDFSNLSLDSLHRCIREIFPHIQSDLLLFESYTECWAEIMNAVFCAFDHSSRPSVQLAACEVYLNLEIKFGFFQLAKVLQHQGFVSLPQLLQPAEQHRWREQSNVFAYYVVKTVLMSDVNGFLLWCRTNNVGGGVHGIFQFGKNQKTRIAFCQLIRARLQDPEVLRRTEEAFDLLHRSRKNAFLRTNLRMTLCEMG